VNFRFINYRASLHTSSGNQTPGFVLPSRTARTNAAIAFPTDLENKVYFSHISFRSWSRYFQIHMYTRITSQANLVIFNRHLKTGLQMILDRKKTKRKNRSFSSLRLTQRASCDWIHQLYCAHQNSPNQPVTPTPKKEIKAREKKRVELWWQSWCWILKTMYIFLLLIWYW
jgi:hypothetical protein